MEIRIFQYIVWECSFNLQWVKQIEYAVQFLFTPSKHFKVNAYTFEGGGGGGGRGGGGDGAM